MLMIPQLHPDRNSNIELPNTHRDSFWVFVVGDLKVRAMQCQRSRYQKPEEYIDVVAQDVRENEIVSGTECERLIKFPTGFVETP